MLDINLMAGYRDSNPSAPDARQATWTIIFFEEVQARSAQNTDQRKNVQKDVLSLVLKEQKVVHPFSPDSFAVQRLELQRWRDILAVPYTNYKSMLVPR